MLQFFIPSHLLKKVHLLPLLPSSLLPSSLPSSRLSLLHPRSFILFHHAIHALFMTSREGQNDDDRDDDEAFVSFWIFFPPFISRSPSSHCLSASLSFCFSFILLLFHSSSVLFTLSCTLSSFLAPELDCK